MTRPVSTPLGPEPNSISISTTLGLNSRARCTASWPVEAARHHLDIGLGGEECNQHITEKLFVLDDQDLDRVHKAPL